MIRALWVIGFVCSFDSVAGIKAQTRASCLSLQCVCVCDDKCCGWANTIGMHVAILHINSIENSSVRRFISHWNKNKRCRKCHKYAMLEYIRNNLLEVCDFDWSRWFVKLPPTLRRRYRRRRQFLMWCQPKSSRHKIGACSFKEFCTLWIFSGYLCLCDSAFFMCEGTFTQGIGTRSHTCWQKPWACILYVGCFHKNSHHKHTHTRKNDIKILDAFDPKRNFGQTSLDGWRKRYETKDRREKSRILNN